MTQISITRSKIDFLYVCLIVFFCSRASTLARSLTDWDHKFILLLPILFMVYYFSIRKIGFSKEILIFIFSFTALNILLSFKFMEFHPRFFIYHVMGFLMAYFAIKALGKDFFIHFENLIYYLCLIAIGMYLVINVLGFPLINILRSLSLLQPGAVNVDTSLLVFTIPVIHDKVLFFRNAGYAWEPGAFSSLTSLAIFTNLILNRFKIRGNTRFWVMVLAMITGQSTTGYFLLFLLFLFVVSNKQINIKHKLPAYFAVIALAAVASTLPFGYEKISRTLDFDVEQLVRNSIAWDKKYVPQRFAAFVIDFKDFLNNPILGYGGHNEAQWTIKAGAEVVSISGLGKIMARFGGIGLFFFLFSLVKSARQLSIDLSFKAWWFLAIIVIVILVSYTLLEQPLIVVFWMYFLLRPKNEIQNQPSETLKQDEAKLMLKRA